MHIHYNALYGHAPAQEPLPGRNQIYNFSRPFFGYHYYILSLVNRATE